MAQRAPAKPAALVVHEVGYEHGEAVEGDLWGGRGRLVGNGRKDVEARDLGFAAGRAPTGNSPLVASNVLKVGAGGAQGERQQSKRKNDAVDSVALLDESVLLSPQQEHQPAEDARAHQAEIGAGRLLHQMVLLAHRFGIPALISLQTRPNRRRTQYLRDFRTVLRQLIGRGGDCVDARRAGARCSGQAIFERRQFSGLA